MSSRSRQARAPIRNKIWMTMCQIVPRHPVYVRLQRPYGKAVCRVLDVPVPLATLTVTEVTVCKRV